MTGRAVIEEQEAAFIELLERHDGYIAIPVKTVNVHVYLARDLPFDHLVAARRLSSLRKTGIVFVSKQGATITGVGLVATSSVEQRQLKKDNHRLKQQLEETENALQLARAQRDEAIARYDRLAHDIRTGRYSRRDDIENPE